MATGFPAKGARAWALQRVDSSADTGCVSVKPGDAVDVLHIGSGADDLEWLFVRVVASAEQGWLHRETIVPFPLLACAKVLQDVAASPGDEDDGYLALDAGDLVGVLYRGTVASGDDGWLFGEDLARRRRGWFPQSAIGMPVPSPPPARAPPQPPPGQGWVPLSAIGMPVPSPPPARAPPQPPPPPTAAESSPAACVAAPPPPRALGPLSPPPRRPTPGCPQPSEHRRGLVRLYTVGMEGMEKHLGLGVLNKGIAVVRKSDLIAALLRLGCKDLQFATDIRDLDDFTRSKPLCKHIGTHPETMAGIVAPKKFAVWLRTVRDDITKLCALGQPLGVAVYSRRGQHRSVAGVRFLQHCLRVVEGFDVEVQHLYADSIWEGTCRGIACDGGCEPPGEAQPNSVRDAALQRAVEIWLDGRR